MKSSGHILGSLLLAGMFSMTHLALGQEEGFNLPRLDLESESKAGGSTSGEGVDFTDPVKKTGKTDDNKKKTEKNEASETVSEPAKELQPVTESKKPAPKVASETSNPDNSPKSNKENVDESVLSFNFLYYMIQKFKFSDVIDQ